MPVNVQRLKTEGFHDNIDDAETSIRDHLRQLAADVIDDALKRAAREADDILSDANTDADVRRKVMAAIHGVGRLTLLMLVVALAACGAEPRTSEWIGVWEGSRLEATQKCAEPHLDAMGAPPRGVMVAFTERSRSEPDVIELAARVDVDNVPQLELALRDTGPRAVAMQGPSVNTADGVRWRVEGASFQDGRANDLVLSFDDVGLGSRLCRYGVLILSGPLKKR